jgi:hypothetical protein
VIGDDGLCKVCGRAAPNWGDERKRGLEADAVEDEEEDDEYEDDDGGDEDEDEAAVSPAEVGEWKERKLCPDGGCVGVIGDDNKCRVCGKAGE